MPSSQARELFLEACSQAVKEAWETRSEGGVAWGYGYAVASHSRKVWYFDDLSKRPGRGGATGMAVNGHAAMFGYTNDDHFSHYEAGADHFVNLMYTFDAAGTLKGAVSTWIVVAESEGFESRRFLASGRSALPKSMVRSMCLPMRTGGDCRRGSPHRAAQERRFKLKYGEFSTITERMDIAERLCGAFDEVLSWAKKDIRYEVKIVNSVEKIDLELRPCTDEEYKNEIAVQAELQKMEFRKDGTPWERAKIRFWRLDAIEARHSWLVADASAMANAMRWNCMWLRLATLPLSPVPLSCTRTTCIAFRRVAPTSRPLRYSCVTTSTKQALDIWQRSAPSKVADTVRHAIATGFHQRADRNWSRQPLQD